jgi:stage II sporulation protein D
MSDPYLTATRPAQALARAFFVASLVALAVAGAAASALGASTFYIRGGGNGHGIGMSQYGAYGYALHGRSYRWILAHYFQGTTLGAVVPGRIVRILLSTGPASFSGAARAGSALLRPGQSYSVRPRANGSLKLVDARGRQVLVAARPLRVSGNGPLSLAGVGVYRGSLELRPDGAGGIETVNAVGLDDYVRGVVSAEVPASWASSALEAQAIAAQTYAITTGVGAATYDLYPDTRSQVYRGVAAETPSTDAAVAATAGQIVTYRGAPAVTYFSSSSGGHTENIENVWPGATPEPWLRGVADPYDAAGGNPYHSWGSDLTLTGAARLLGGLVKGKLIGIRVTARGTSTRVLRATVVGTGGRTAVTGAQLQQAFGLLTTLMAFTTISTFAATPPSLHGSVFPAPHDGTLAIEVRRGARWRTIARANVVRGAYGVPVPGRGTYRVSFAGLHGPAVRIG